ncbi:MAG TPA: phosphoribosylanthranilate isomerase [Firmicutes bacterium]|nr:phosphoribosylanthranilate isomerase [Bacillota bacterium]
MVGVKICGITNLKDALLAAEAGANAVGFILAPSPRRISCVTVEEIAKRLPPFVLRVGVITPEADRGWIDLFAAGVLDLIQIHGDPQLPEWAPPARMIRAVPVRSGSDFLADQDLSRRRCRALLLDTYKPGYHGGTGETFDWREVSRYKKYNLPVILAGGLRADNVQTALDLAAPSGVDVGSGVESAPGRKDPVKVNRFIQAVRSWEKKRRGNADATG